MPKDVKFWIKVNFPEDIKILASLLRNRFASQCPKQKAGFIWLLCEAYLLLQNSLSGESGERSGLTKFQE